MCDKINIVCQRTTKHIYMKNSILDETSIASTPTRVWSLSNLIAIVALVGTVVTSVGSLVGYFDPTWGASIAGIGALILSITGRVTGTPVK
jgi:hypothetical protein